jgi:metal-sulfur cluster biosynthetic enzyme
MIDEVTVRATLNTIVDPCSVTAGTRAGIEEMGLVRRLEIEPEPAGAVVRLTIGVTEPGCVMGFPFANEAQERLSRLPGVARVVVDLDHAYDWLPTDMSLAYRKRLERDRELRAQTTGVRVRRAEMSRRAASVSVRAADH